MENSKIKKTIKEKKCNHEIWYDCPKCELTYDARAFSRCPNCGQKPIKTY